MKRELEAEYLHVLKTNGRLEVTAVNKKEWLWGAVLLENAKVTIEDNIIEITGTQINKFYSCGHLEEKDIPENSIIYGLGDIITKRYRIFWTKQYLKKGYYERVKKKDYQLSSNITWILKLSNGKALSIEDLA